MPNQVGSLDSLIGREFSHYRIVKQLGGAGTGIVCEAEDNRLHRNVALKFLPDNLAKDPHALARFQREAHTTADLAFGSVGMGTTILSVALTCSNSYAYSSTGTVNNATWATGTVIDPAMAGTLTETSIAMIVEYTD